MKKQDKELQVSRRNFLRQTGCAALGYTALVNTLSHLTVVNSALGQTTLPGYRALVVVFLFGGNDSSNMLIPRMGHPGYNDYKAARRILGILDANDPARPATAPASIPISTPDGNYGVHPNLQPMADLFNTDKLAFVANVGTLAYPILTQADYINGTVPVPPQLFSHSDQLVQWQSSWCDQPFRSGWGGRVADILAPAASSSGSVSLSIALDGVHKFLVGDEVVQYTVGAGGALTLNGYGTNYAAAWDGTNYLPSTEGRKLKAFEDIMRYTKANLLEESYSEVLRRSRANEGLIGAAMTAAAASGLNFDALFPSSLNNSLMSQLKMAAKMIAGRSALGNSRQIFFVTAGGYDTHSAQNGAHANLMTELGECMKAFYDATVQLGVSNNVLTMSHSDFGRTLIPNGTDEDGAGSDHAWGGHQFVMGGSVNGGRIYGLFPSLALNTERDVDSRSGSGRWIPTTSVDQFAASAARWMGVDASSLNQIFPNLHRFNDPFGASANLGYITL